jgi:hypothetical protein
MPLGRKNITKKGQQFRFMKKWMKISFGIHVKYYYQLKITSPIHLPDATLAD